MHNWAEEFEKFAPDFKVGIVDGVGSWTRVHSDRVLTPHYLCVWWQVLPYWCSTADRKVLRQFWNPKTLSTRTADFHVLVTTYTLVRLAYLPTCCAFS